MNPSTIEIVGTVLFGLAVLHTFTVKFFEKQAHKYPEGSIGENLFHFLGEVEAVFGLWAAVFVVAYSFIIGFAIHGDPSDPHLVTGGAIHYLESLNFTEPAFVFVIMCMAGTRPIILMAEKAIISISRFVPLPKKMAFYITTLILGPLLGSFITEPAAMTVTALILLDYFYSDTMSNKFKYATLGLLFVNISIGGTLTHFAAPPVLMVAGKWKWGIAHMMGHFGFKAAISVIIGTIITAVIFKKELVGELKVKQPHQNEMNPTWWMYLMHIFFMVLVVVTAHHMAFFLGLFLFFLGFMKVTGEYQDKPKLTESLLVGFFLGGLVTLGKVQAWWISPLLERLGDFPLYVGSTALTAITDNAALTYLGSLVEGISDTKKFSLVAGAVAGGGLTVIANAPNPAGYGILKDSFGEAGIKPAGLLVGALAPTLLALVCFRLIPSLAL